MGTFDRGLDDAFVELLNKEYDKDGWWRGLVDDPQTFFAIRNGYVNVYYRGCSLLRWDAGAPTWKIHYKYLLRPEIEAPYVNVGGGKPILPDDTKGFFIENIEDLKLIKKAVAPYAGREKTGVHEIILANENILDVEVASDHDRIDFVALQKTDRGIDLVFFEAKHFSDSRLRGEVGKQPEVVEQVERYRCMLREEREAIRDSYWRVCKNLTELRGLAELYPKRHAMMKDVVVRQQSLFINENPRLIVFGFDQDQKDGSVWKPHRQKLQEAIGKKRVLLRGKTYKFRKGISTAY